MFTEETLNGKLYFLRIEEKKNFYKVNDKSSRVKY